MRDTIEMVREAWAKAGEGWVDQNWYLDREKAFKELVSIARADEREALQAEVLEQCRINGMSAEREDALRAELTRLKASIALDKMAEDAVTIGLRLDDWDKIGCVNHDCDKCKAQPAVPLTPKEIAEFVGTHEFGPEQLKWFRLGEAAHGITKGQP
jgi:hypothetical protein